VYQKKEEEYMSRKVEKNFDQGTYEAEFVEEMKPLGADRKTQFIPETPPDKIASLGGRTLGIFLSTIMNALSRRFGEEVWDVAREAMYEVGRRRAVTMVRTMKIDDLKDARCLGRIMDLEDNNSGIRGEWIETGKNRAIKREYECPLATPCKESPKICSVLLEALEQGTLDAVGVKLKGPTVLTKTLPAGDPYCEVTLELED
jgi:predicted ArsR family transcriptional regulator